MTIPQMPVALNGKTHAPPDLAGSVSLRAVSPADLPLLWKWLQEYPRANFDDYGPKTFEEFQAEIARRVQNEYVICALLDGKPVGAMGFTPITARLGSLHGICFSKAVHGKGVAPFAVRNFLRIVMENGKVQKIAASYFKDNMRIKKFLRGLGFVHEGSLTDHTLRDGKPTDMTLVALYRHEWEAGRAT